MALLTMPRPRRAQTKSWGETKPNRCAILLTDTANLTLELVMERTRHSRSEVVERMIRGDAEVQQAIAAALADVMAQAEQPDSDAQV